MLRNLAVTVLVNVRKILLESSAVTPPPPKKKFDAYNNEQDKS